MIAGVPQDFVLQPQLGDIMYNGGLALRVPEERTLNDFAGDLAMVVVAKHPKEMELEVNKTIQAIKP